MLWNKSKKKGKKKNHCAFLPTRPLSIIHRTFFFSSLSLSQSLPVSVFQWALKSPSTTNSLKMVRKRLDLTKPSGWTTQRPSKNNSFVCHNKLTSWCNQIHDKPKARLQGLEVSRFREPPTLSSCFDTTSYDGFVYPVSCMLVPEKKATRKPCLVSKEINVDYYRALPRKWTLLYLITQILSLVSKSSYVFSSFNCLRMQNRSYKQYKCSFYLDFPIRPDLDSSNKLRQNKNGYCRLQKTNQTDLYNILQCHL